MFDAGWGTFPVYAADAVEGTYHVEVTRGPYTFATEATPDDAIFEGVTLPDLREGQGYRIEVSAWPVDQRPGIEPPLKPDP